MSREKETKKQATVVVKVDDRSLNAPEMFNETLREVKGLLELNLDCLGEILDRSV